MNTINKEDCLTMEFFFFLQAPIPHHHISLILSPSFQEIKIYIYMAYSDFWGVKTQEYWKICILCIFTYKWNVNKINELFMYCCINCIRLREKSLLRQSLQWVKGKESSSFIRTTVEQDTVEKRFSSVPWGGDGDWLLFWMFWIRLEGHCTIREPGERIVDAVCSTEQPRRAKRSVAEHKTLAGMYCWIAAWREGGRWSILSSVPASTRILNLIRAAVGTSREMHALALSVRRCMCEDQIKGAL